MKARASVSVVLMALCLVSVSGCGGDDDGSTGAGAASSGSAGASSSSGGDGPGGGSVGGGGAGAAGGSGGSGGSGGAAPCVLADTWTTVDDFVFPGSMNLGLGGMTRGPDGAVYGAGLAVVPMDPHGVVRASKDGQTFSTIADHVGIGSDVAVATDGTLFAIGGDGAGTARVVQRSKDAGKTWEIVDTVPFDAGACNTGLLALADSGELLAAGSCDTTGWRVRASSDGGTAWSTVLDGYQLVPGMVSRLASVHVGPGGVAFAAGIAQDAQQVGHWMVLRRDSATWSPVDDFLLEPGASGASPKLGGTSALYAVGAAGAADGQHWIVRRADADGNTWSTIDDYLPAGSTGAFAAAIHEAADGTLVVVGAVSDAGGANRMVVRRSADGSSWTPMDDFVLAAGMPTAPNALVADGQGNLYASVRAVDASDGKHWIVRKLACIAR